MTITLNDDIKNSIGFSQNIVSPNCLPLHRIGQRRAIQFKIRTRPIARIYIARKIKSEPKFGSSKVEPNPRLSSLWANEFSPSSEACNYYPSGTSSKIASVGIISKAATLRSTVKTAYAFAGGVIANRGMKIMIYYERIMDQTWFKVPATTAFTAMSLEKDPVS